MCVLPVKENVYVVKRLNVIVLHVEWRRFVERAPSDLEGHVFYVGCLEVP